MEPLCPLLEQSRLSAFLSHVVFTTLEAARTPCVWSVYLGFTSEFAAASLPISLVRCTSVQLSHLVTAYHKPRCGAGHSDTLL